MLIVFLRLIYLGSLLGFWGIIFGLLKSTRVSIIIRVTI